MPTAEQPLRLAEFDELFSASACVERLAPQHLRITLAGGENLAALEPGRPGASGADPSVGVCSEIPFTGAGVTTY